MRSKITQYLDQIEKVKTPKQIEMINNIADQYYSSIETWTKKNIPTEGIQTKAEVTAWLNSLPAKTLENLASHGPIRLKFIPPEKALELLKAVKGGTCFWDEGWKDVGTESWEFGLTTDKADIPQDPKIYFANGVDEKDGTRKNDDMVDLWEQKYREQGLDIMPQEAWVPSIADALAQGKVLRDRDYYTTFKGQKGAAWLANVNFFRSRVILSNTGIGRSDEMLRCRPWLKGEKV